MITLDASSNAPPNSITLYSIVPRRLSAWACTLRARLLPVCRFLALGLIIVGPQRIGELREAVAQAGIDAATGKVLLTHWLDLGHHPYQLLDEMRRLHVWRECQPLIAWHVLTGTRARVDMGVLQGCPRGVGGAAWARV